MQAFLWTSSSTNPGLAMSLSQASKMASTIISDPKRPKQRFFTILAHGVFDREYTLLAVLHFDKLLLLASLKNFFEFLRLFHHCHPVHPDTQRHPETPRDTQRHPETPRDTQRHKRHPEIPRDTQ